RKYATAAYDLVHINRTPLIIHVDKSDYFVPDIVHFKESTAQTATGLGQAIAQSTGASGQTTAALNPGSQMPPVLIRFKERSLSGVDDKSFAAVFVTDPKEEAQNISDVAATEQLKNIVLSVQAVLPQYGLNAGNYTDYVSRSQEKLQGILRRPLV